MEEPLQYEDVVAWQEELLQHEQVEQQPHYWQQINFSQLTTTHLPLRPEARNSHEDKNPSGQSEPFFPHVQSVPLDEELVTQLQAARQFYAGSLPAYLLTCWQVALWLLMGEKNSLLGVACDGRVDEELANTLGLYTRFLPLQMLLAHELPFEQALKLVHADLEAAFEEQLSFTWPQTAEASAEPLYFPLSFEYSSCPVAFENGDLRFSFERCYSCIEPLALKMSMYHAGKQAIIDIYYDHRYYDSEQMRILSGVVHTLLHASLKQPALAIGRMPLLPVVEQEPTQQALRTPTSLPPDATLIHLFERQAAKMADQPAVIG